jgi:5-formyltetrahydrofolate cyclo-ligase
MSSTESNVPRDDCISLAAIKRSLRAELINRRSALTLAQHATFSAAIVARLVQILTKTLRSEQSTRVGLYWPIKNEVDVRDLASQLTVTNTGEVIQWALPAIETSSNKIIYGLWQPGDTVVKGPLSIMQPAQFNRVEVDVMLIPCVGFNNRGYRIGYGGGYFDRTLTHSKAIPIGVAFDLSQCEWVAEDHDRPLQTIVTQTTTVSRSG